MSSMSSITSRIIPSTVEITEDSQFRDAVEKKVMANTQNKLLGTTGGTIVCFHSGEKSTPLECRSIAVMRELQNAVELKFGKLMTTLPKTTLKDAVKAESYRGNISDLENLHKGDPKYCNVSKTGDALVYKESSSDDTGFVKIRNLHTTVISQHVVDTTKGKEGWDEKVEVAKYYRAFVDFHDSKPDSFIYSIDGQTCTKEGMISKVGGCDNLTQVLAIIEASSLTEDEKQELKELSKRELVNYSDALEKMPEVQLVATEIKVTDNGSLVVQWGPSDELVHLKKALVSYGATAKGTLASKFTGTTLGFFPKYHLMPLEKRKALEVFLQDFVSKHISKELSITITPEKLSVVKFERNDLSPQFSTAAPLMASEGKVNASREFVSNRRPVDF